MRYRYFDIENFKGIKRLRFDLDASRSGNVYTLVGLNESGKTTVLEAINYFSFGAEPTDPGALERDVAFDDLVPIAERDNFNGDVRISAGVELSDDEISDLKKHMQSRHQYLLSEISPTFEIQEIHRFENSIHVEREHLWELDPIGRRTRQKNEREMDDNSEEWGHLINFLRDRLPSIRFFPNFLFDIPNRIFIGAVADEPTAETDTQADKRSTRILPNRGSTIDLFYKDVLQDILDSLDREVNVREHILARAAKGAGRHKRSLEALLLKMSRNVTDLVFGSWDEMFGRRKIDRSKAVRIEIEQEEDGGVRRFYVKWQIEDSNGLSDIGEQSLGFRWFFAYRLLTVYRGRRKGSPGLLLLFDEPASNLHSSAQALLLESLGVLSASGIVIYTTHSHHLINPRWLGSAYVVKNAALDYKAEDFGFNARKTDISMELYRQFAVNHPDQRHYFQPILDVLDYRPSALELVPRLVMLEGQTDFYALRLGARLTSLDLSDVGLLPGTGAGTLGDLIALYIGWARNFVVLLDSDSEGHRQRARYIDKFGSLVEARIFLLEDVASSWAGKRIEDLFNKSDRLAIQRVATPQAEELDKKQFRRGLQEIVATESDLAVGKRTSANLDRVLEFLLDRLT